MEPFTISFLIIFIPRNDETGSKPEIERVQALADISRSAVCCHINETHAPITNPSNSAQIEGTPYHSPSYFRVRAVVWGCGEEQTDRHTQTAVANIHFTSTKPHTKCNFKNQPQRDYNHSLTFCVRRYTHFQ